MANPYPGLNFDGGVDFKDVNPAILKNLSRLARATNQTITVASGFRTLDQQKALYKRYIDSGKDIRYIAAPPGKSAHETGNAVDANVNGTSIANFYTGKQLAKFGLSAPVPGDQEHIQLLGSSKYKGGQSGGSNDTGTSGSPTTTPRMFSTAPAHPSDIQQNTGVSDDGAGTPSQQLATLWQQIANQQFSSPETKMFAQNSAMANP